MDASYEEKVHGIEDTYTKYNPIIASKYRASLLENKILSIGLASTERLRKDEKTGYLVQEFRSSELRRLLGTTSHALYKQLDNVAQDMTSRTIGLRDPENKTFDYISVVTRASYKDGVFRIEWNAHLTDYLFALKNNFTKLHLKTMLSFKTTYGFRLHEYLKSKCYPPRDYESGRVFTENISVAELRLTLGVVNAELDKVRHILKGSETPDYETAVAASPEKVLESWTHLRTKAIDPAIREINSITDMQVSYEAHGSGQGGKIRDVTFIMKRKESKKEPVDQDDVLDAVSDLTHLKMKDVRSICKAADYDLSRIEEAWAYYEAYPKEVENPVGLVIEAIKNGYAEKEKDAEWFLKVV